MAEIIHDFTHGKAGGVPNKVLPDADAYRFRAPRGGDLVVCPYCNADGSSCDFCDEGSIPADEVLVEMDLHRLDCAVDALRAADLTTHREALSRILSNLTDLMETPNGHAH